MRGGRGFIAALALALAIPASAAAQDGRVTYVSFKAPATHGYELVFFARAGKRSHVTVTVSRGRAWAAGSTRNGEPVDAEFSRGVSAATYQPRDARISGRRVVVDLGPLGSIAMRFEERSDRSVDRRCLRGRLRRGGLVGSLDFEGEAGFARVERMRVRARIATVRRTCPDGGRRPLEGATSKPNAWLGPQLFACGSLPGTLLIADRDRYTSFFYASLFERTPFARIVRNTAAFRETTDFASRRDLTTAKLRPSPPLFAGAASYRDGATTGDLRVRLPGRGMVLMAGGEAALFTGTAPIPDCPGVPGSFWGASTPALAASGFIRDGRGDLRLPSVRRLTRLGATAPAP